MSQQASSSDVGCRCTFCPPPRSMSFVAQLPPYTAMTRALHHRVNVDCRLFAPPGALLHGTAHLLPSTRRARYHATTHRLLSLSTALGTALGKGWRNHRVGSIDIDIFPIPWDTGKAQKSSTNLSALTSTSKRGTVPPLEFTHLLLCSAWERQWRRRHRK